MDDHRTQAYLVITRPCGDWNPSSGAREFLMQVVGDPETKVAALGPGGVVQAWCVNGVDAVTLGPARTVRAENGGVVFEARKLVGRPGKAYVARKGDGVRVLVVE